MGWFEMLFCDCKNGFLWIVNFHSLKKKKKKEEERRPQQCVNSMSISTWMNESNQLMPSYNLSGFGICPAAHYNQSQIGATYPDRSSSCLYFGLSHSFQFSASHFGYDFRMCFRYCQADDRLLEAVEFLDLGNGAGWELLQVDLPSETAVCYISTLCLLGCSIAIRFPICSNLILHT